MNKPAKMNCSVNKYVIIKLLVGGGGGFTIILACLGNLGLFTHLHHFRELFEAGLSTFKGAEQLGQFRESLLQVLQAVACHLGSKNEQLFSVISVNGWDQNWSVG